MTPAGAGAHLHLSAKGQTSAGVARRNSASSETEFRHEPEVSLATASVLLFLNPAFFTVQFDHPDRHHLSARLRTCRQKCQITIYMFDRDRLSHVG